MYVHESNIDNKISSDYGGKSKQLEEFKSNSYLPMRKKIEEIDLSTGIDSFRSFAEIINEYRQELNAFAKKHNIKSQSKFESTFLEEISYYLFRDIPKIKDNSFHIFNKGIYAGLKINDSLNIDVITKDVDFCIGKKVQVSIDDHKAISLIIPAVSVEVKTYLDATMFGEIKSSSKTLKSATPNSRAYVLMGYRNLRDEHIIAARQDSTLDDMFVLQKDEHSPIDYKTLYEYYKEIVNAINELTITPTISVPGRLLKTNG